MGVRWKFNRLMNESTIFRWSVYLTLSGIIIGTTVSVLLNYTSSQNIINVIDEHEEQSWEETFELIFGEYGLNSSIILKTDLISGYYMPYGQLSDILTEEDYKKAESFFSQANNFALSEMYDEAIELYDKSIEIHSNATNVWYNKGTVFLLMGHFDEAIEPLERALDIEPRKNDALNNLAAAYFKTGDYDMSLALYRKSLEFYPDNPVAISGYGVVLGEIGNYPEAIKYFNKYPNIEESWLVLYNRGLMFYKLGNHSKALEDFNNSLKIKETVGSLFFSAASYLLSEKYQKALELFDYTENNYFDELTEDMKRDIYYNRGSIYLQFIIDYNKSYINFKKAMLLDEKNINVLKGVGRSSLELGKNDEAIYYFEKIVEMYDSDFAWHFLGSLYTKNEDFETALNAYNKVLETFPDSEVDVFGKAWVLYNLKRYPESLDAIKHALSINPDNEIAKNLNEAILCQMKGNCKVNFVT